MYVKVYKENNQWFREDNGALVGNDIPLILGHAFTCNDETIVPCYGYISGDGSFQKLCTGISCSFTCLSECNPNCRYTNKAESEGYYFISD